jgi:hypothetical protein
MMAKVYFFTLVVHRPGGTLAPVNTVFLWNSMHTSVAKNAALHPALQMVPIDKMACP